MMTLRKRLMLAGGVATLALLALPSFVSASPGTGPELVQRSGRLVVMHADREDGSSTRQWMLVDGLAEVPVRAPSDVWVDPGSRVRLEGSMQGGTLVLADSLTAVTQLAPSPLAAVAPADTAAALTLQSTAVILFGFSGGPDASTLPPAAQTAGNAQALVFGAGPDSVQAYYLEQTYGQLGFTGQVFGGASFEISDSSTTCTTNDLDTWASKAEQLVGIRDDQYQHYIFVFPKRQNCGFTGIAEVGGKHSWINGDFTVRVVAHELGHNLGLAHAGGLACTSGGVPAPMGDSCSAQGFEYLDPFDAMGSGDSQVGLSLVRQMSMEHKLALHLLPSSAVKVVGVSGSYHIAPMETLSGSAELLRIPKLGGGGYFVEYRQPIGFYDSQAPALSGIYIRTESPEVASDPSSPNADTALIDMHPATPADWGDAAMDPGQLFSDPLRGITIQTVAQDAAGATLLITMPPDTVPPSAPTGLSAVLNGTTSLLRWSAAADNITVDHYVVLRDGSQVGSSETTDFTDTGLIPGTTVGYSVAAVDAAGNVGPAVAVNLAIPDTTPPGAPPKLIARLTKAGTVALTWRAAADNGRIAGYRIRRAGEPIATRTSRSYVDKAPKPGSGSTVTYTVAAFDLAGNVGPARKAKPLRAALLRKLTVSNLRIASLTLGAHTLVRVKGTVSDSRAVCRLRIGTGAWRFCRAKASGTFAVNLAMQGSVPVTLSLRDALGRVKKQTLPVR
jgi:hypothetical protein